MSRIKESTIEMLALRRIIYFSKRDKCNINNYPDFDVYKQIIEEAVHNGMKCYYCNKKMKVKDKSPFADVISIDHKVPICKGGSSKKDNLVACCYNCNILKGTKSEEEFKKLIKILYKIN